MECATEEHRGKMANELGLVSYKQPVAILPYGSYEVSTQSPNTKHL